MIDVCEAIYLSHNAVVSDKVKMVPLIIAAWIYGREAMGWITNLVNLPAFIVHQVKDMVYPADDLRIVKAVNRSQYTIKTLQACFS